MDFQPKTPGRLSPGHLHSFTCWLRLLKRKCLHSSTFLGPRTAFLQRPRLRQLSLLLFPTLENQLQGCG